jgi:hypothetical protein
MLRIGTALALLLVLAAAIAPATARVRAQHEPLAVIMAARTKITSLSAAELTRVFRGMLTRNEDGDRFVPVNQPAGTPLRAAFDQAVLGLSSAQAQAFWIDQKIRGAVAEPRTVTTVALAVKFVAIYPGAISYAPRSTAAVPELKIIKIDGKLPGDSGYLLR